MAQKRFAVLVLGVGSRAEAKFIRVRPTSRRWCMVPSELSLPSSLIESAIVFSFVQFSSCQTCFFLSFVLSVSLYLFFSLIYLSVSPFSISLCVFLLLSHSESLSISRSQSHFLSFCKSPYLSFFSLSFNSFYCVEVPAFLKVVVNSPTTKRQNWPSFWALI